MSPALSGFNVAERFRGRNKREIMSTKSAIMFTRLPQVIFTLDQCQRHGQAVTAD